MPLLRFRALAAPLLPGQSVGEDQADLGDEHQPFGEPGPEKDADQAGDRIGINQRDREPDADAGKRADRRGDQEAEKQNFIGEPVPARILFLVSVPLHGGDERHHADG
ncbi:hypothetical protein D3C80_1830290 [compost metagenome]